MKKILLIISMVFVLLLPGCGTEKEKVISKREPINLKLYEGIWKTENDSNDMDYVEIKSNEDETISFEYSVMSDTLDVAKINVSNICVNENGIGEFEFENDEWNNSGEGIIKLGSGEVEVKIEKISKNSSGEEWSIKSGKYEKHIVGE